MFFLLWGLVKSLIFAIFLKFFEKSRIIKTFPLDEFSIFLKILKNHNAIFQMRRLRASDYL